MSLRYAFNTNGCAHHRLDDAIGLVADSGYDGIALTLDVGLLDPFADGHAAALRQAAAMLSRRGLGVVIETGARFLLDPRAKHEPTLVTAAPEGRARRIEFLTRALEAGAETGAEAMSFWAGIPAPGLDPAQARGWLRAGLEEVVRRAERLGVVAALEPEPSMLIETVADFAAIADGLPGLRLALDLGHCLVTQDIEPDRAVLDHADRLGTVTIEDMRRGVHEHLPFGAGDLDLGAALGALRRIGFERLVCVELSRDSHRADRMVPAAIATLRAAEAALA